MQQSKDGKYIWNYELNLFKNPIILFTILKIITLVVLGLFIFDLLISIDNLFLRPGETLFGVFKAMVIVYIILIGLSLVGYVIYALITGGKYCVIFEMDEEGIRHTQLDKKYKKAEAIGIVATMLGVSTNNPITTGIGLTSASSNSIYTKFSNVKHKKNFKVFYTIKIDAPLSHNQIYVEKEDFDFVNDYIQSRIK